ncbi:hypothetical protein VaNZ11_005675 [Volvox africanus]|uniref:Uncharacterized protein n=1 Tax=Volvox africanus TaxID=51714 RepID=A0ABQ5S0Q9_9CHLO|nr:hypothetical protein VaNZ11_005675 [Volvox africanus]
MNLFSEFHRKPQQARKAVAKSAVQCWRTVFGNISASSSSRRCNNTTVVSAQFRRTIVLTALSGMPKLALQPAAADVLRDALRDFTRPDITAKDAVVILLDAQSTLREIQGIAATSQSSQERFRARAVWPAYAKRLRAVAEAAPVVAKLVIGTSDKEETLSEYYGGKAEGTGAADAVYQGLGRVLTISGRTIRLEAQAAPDVAAGAEWAIDNFLQQVPPLLLAEAQQFRLERAKAAGMR